MKKIFALLLALVMVMGLAVSASAASITVDNRHTYDVYQIFTGTLADGKLTNVQLGENGVLPAGQDLEEALAALTALNTETDESVIAAAAAKYVDLDSDPVGTVSKDSPLTGLAAGYYMLVDVTTPLPEDENEDGSVDVETLSLYVLQIVGDVTVENKFDKVTGEKKVYDVNDSEGTTEVREDSADYDIGDRVKFQLVATMPADYANYDYYYLAFHDSCGEGLTFDATSRSTMVVAVDGTAITSGYEIVTNPTDGCTFEVVFEDAKLVSAIKAGSVITVDYTAVLNENAALGAAGNENKMKLEFSNDPNYEHDPDNDPTTPPPPDPPTDETPWDTTIVFTFEVSIDKVDEEGDALVGATFTLFKKLPSKPDTGVAGTDYFVKKDDKNVETYWTIVDVIEGDNKSTFEWKGVDDGTYRLEETVTPPGYNTMEPIEFKITASHDDEAAEPELLTLSASEPFQADKSTGALTADIENKPGVELPTTGGIGTTMLYIVGSVLVLAAIVMLITKKRMSNAE